MATPDIGKPGTKFVPGTLYSARLAGTSAVPVVTVASGHAVKIETAVVTNVSAAQVTVTAGLIPSGGSVDGTHEVLHQLRLGAGDSQILDEIIGMMLGDGDEITITQGADASLDVVITGIVMS